MLRKMVRRLVWVLRLVLGIHPEVPANDTGVVLFASVVLFTGLVAYCIVKATLGAVFIVHFLPLLVAAYLFADAFYAVWRSIFYRHTVRVDVTARTNGGSAGIWRYGEYVGIAFVLLTLALPVLVAFKVALPFGWGMFMVNRAETFVAADITVGILAASSIAKLWAVPTRPRVAHNTLLLILCFATTASMLVLLFEEARGGPEVPEGSFWSYTTILASYAVHNAILSIVCPQCRQRRPGHLAALAVLFFTVAIFAALGIFGALPAIPNLLLSFFVTTIGILLVSGILKYLLEEPIVRAFLGADTHTENNGNGQDPGSTE